MYKELQSEGGGGGGGGIMELSDLELEWTILSRGALTPPTRDCTEHTRAVVFGTHQTIAPTDIGGSSVFCVQTARTAGTA